MIFSKGYFYNYILAAALTLQLFGLGVAQVDRYTVAVLPFSVSDPTGRTPAALGETLPNYFEAPIFNSQKFILIDQSITDKLVADIASSEEGLTATKIKELGARYGVDIFVAGGITVEGQAAPSSGTPATGSPQPYVINARFIDTSIGEVRSVTQIRVSSDADFQTAAQYITNDGLTRFPLEGQIYAISGEDIYIDIGSVQGLSSQDRTGYIYRQVQIKSKLILEQIGTFTIKTMYDDSSKISVDMVIGYDPKEGDSVTIGPVIISDSTPATDNVPSPDTEAIGTTSTDTASTGTAATAPSTEISLPDATSDTTVTTPTSNVVATGTLSVTSNVQTEVYLDGEFRGMTPLTLSVTAGSYTLELWAEGHETLEQTINIAASETLTLNETLSSNEPTSLNETTSLNEAQTEPSEPALATMTLSLTPPGTVVRIDGKLQLNRSFTLSPGTYTLEFRHQGYETKTQTLTVAAGEMKNLSEVLTSTQEAPAAVTATSDAVASSDTATSDTATSDVAVTPGDTGDNTKATLELTVFPPDASILIDGLPSEAGALTLASGTHTLEVTQDGYEAFSTELVLEPEQVLPFDVTLAANRVDSSGSTTEASSAGASSENTQAATDTGTIETATTTETASTPAFVTLSERTCADAASLKSGESTNETEILFMNQSNDPVKTYWVNYGGGLEFYNDLLPGQEVLQQTAPGHVWIVTDANNQCLAIFEPVAETGRAVLR